MHGGFSFDNVSMQERLTEDPSLTTSTLLPDSVVGTNLMSSDAEANPSFHDFVHTFVPYCSSDLWLGSAQSSSTVMVDDDDDSTIPPIGELDVDFLGHYIVEAVLMEMIGSHLPSAEDGGVLVLGGASAGGFGVGAHVEVNVRVVFCELC
jgi:hypothetical protein